MRITMKLMKLGAVVMSAGLLMAGCNVQTKEQAVGNSGQEHSDSDASAQQQTVELSLVTMSSFEEQANVVRDQLKKIGIDVKVNLFSDYGSYSVASKSGEHDMSIMTYSGSGSPDGQIRSLYYTGGSANDHKIEDPELDALMDKAAAQTPQDYTETYKEYEQKLVVEKTYTVPLWTVQRIAAFNKDVDIDSIDYGGPAPRWFRTTSFIDKGLNDTRTYNFAVSSGSPDTFDSLRGSSGTTYAANSNINIRLLHSNSAGELTTEGTLSRNYAIAGNNDTFYFLLRDDINFGKVEDMKAVDTGVKVGAEDVIYSYDRVRDVVSVPGNAGKEYLSSVKDVSIVTDLEELKNAKISNSDDSVLNYFNKNEDTACSELVETKEQVDNSAGKYQVVKITTVEPFPQQLINLGATQLGIVSKETVSSVNEGITADSYDPNTDVLYGDVTPMRLGDQYNNNMWFSGPYVITHIDDYGTYLERNPGYAPGTEEAAQIKNMALKVITDNATQTAALRNGELDEGSPAGNNVAICESDPNVNVWRGPHISVGSLTFYRTGGSETLNQDLRHAILYAINQDELITIIGDADLAHSMLCMIDTGWYPKQDLDKAKEAMKLYFDSKK